MSTTPTATLTSMGKRHRKRPVIHVLMPDGRVTEVKGRGIVIPDADDGDDGVLAVLINRKGEIYTTPDGKVAIVAVPVVGLSMLADPTAPSTYKAMAEKLGVSLPTVKRMVADGRLAQPEKVGKRAVRFRQADLDAIRATLKR